MRVTVNDFEKSVIEKALEEPAAPIDQSAAIEKARTALEEILRRMGVAATVQQKSAADGAEIILEIKAADSGLLIGRKGQTLEALQYGQVSAKDAQANAQADATSILERAAK